MELMHSQVVSQLNDLLRAHRLRLRGNQATLPPLLWWILILGAVITIVISWFLVSQRVAVQLILSALIGLLLGSLLFLTAAMDNPFRGEFSVDADAFDSVLNEMIKY
jgi:CHASE2 domain-containing sensor protein